MRVLKFFVIFLIIFSWIYSGWPQVWQNPPAPLNRYLSGPFPPKIQFAQAAIAFRGTPQIGSGTTEKGSAPPNQTTLISHRWPRAGNYLHS